jgi:hypothetical protein
LQGTSSEHADYTRRIAERRHRCELRRVDVLARHEQLDRLDARGTRRLDEILAFADEQAQLLALARGREPSDQLQAPV